MRRPLPGGGSYQPQAPAPPIDSAEGPVIEDLGVVDTNAPVLGPAIETMESQARSSDQGLPDPNALVLAIPGSLDMPTVHEPTMYENWINMGTIRFVPLEWNMSHLNNAGIPHQHPETS